MGSFIDALVKDKKSRRKGVVERVLSKKESYHTHVESAGSKKDRDKRMILIDQTHAMKITSTHKNEHKTNRHSKDMAKQIYEENILAETPATNRHSSSSSIISQRENSSHFSTSSRKSTTASIQMETPMDTEIKDKRKPEKKEKRESVNIAKQNHQSGQSDEKPAMSKDIAAHSPIPKTQNIAETSNILKKSNKTPMLIEYEKEPTMLIKPRVERTKLQLGDANIKVTTEKLQKHNKMSTDKLEPSDLSDPHCFEHVSGYSILESQWRSGHTQIENSPESMHGETLVPKNKPDASNKSLTSVQKQEEEKINKVKIEKPGKVKRGDISKPNNLEHTSGFSKLGVSYNDFDVDYFLKNEDLQIKSGLLGSKNSDISMPNFINNSVNDNVGENDVDIKKKSTISTDIQIFKIIAEIPEEQNDSDRLKNSTQEESLEKVVETLKLKTETEKGTSTQLKKGDVNVPFSFEHVNGYNKYIEEYNNKGINLGGVYERSNVDIDKQQEGADQIREKILERPLEKVQIPQKSKKKKTGKLKMSEISDPVHFEHVSGYTKVNKKSDESDADQLWSDDGGVTDDDTFCQNKKEKKTDEQEINQNISALVKEDKTKENPHKDNKIIVKKGDISGPHTIEHVSGFSKLGMSIENFDFESYANNQELFAQSVAKEIAITKEGCESEYQHKENSTLFTIYDSNDPSLLNEKNKLLTRETTARSSENIELYHNVKQIETKNIQEISQKEKTIKLNEEGDSNNRYFDNDSKEWNDKDIEEISNKDCMSFEKKELTSYSRKAMNAPLGNLNVQKEKQPSREEKEIVKTENVSDPVYFQHIGGFSKLGVRLENFDVNSYVEKEVSFMPGESDPNMIKYQKAVNDTVPTTQKVKKHKSKQLKKEELSEPVNFEHTLGYLKDQGSDSEEWNDEDIILSNGSYDISYNANMKNVGQGSSHLGDVTLIDAQSISNESQENGNEKHLETSLPTYSSTPSMISENFDSHEEETTDEGSKLTTLHRGVQLIPDRVKFKSIRRNRATKKKLKKEDIGQPQDMRHTYGHSKRNFGAARQTFDKQALEIEYQESLVRAINSEIKGQDNKVRLFIQHLTPRKKELSQNSLEDDKNFMYGTSLLTRRSVDSANTSDVTDKQNLNTIEPETIDNELKNTENIYNVQHIRVQKEEHQLLVHKQPSQEVLAVIKQIREGPALKSVSENTNKNIHETHDYKDIISNVNQKENDKADHISLEENIHYVALKTYTGNGNLNVGKTIKEGPVGQMAEILGKRSQAICASSDSEYDDNLSEGESCV